MKKEEVNWKKILGWILLIIGILLFISPYLGCMGTENDFQCLMVSLMFSISKLVIGLLFLIGGIIILATKQEHKQKSIIIVGAILVLALLFFWISPKISYNAERVSCLNSDKVETVMTEGMEIIANFNGDIMKISAGPCYERTYTWEDKTCTILQQPYKERWYGNLGIYSPSKMDWKSGSCGGLVHSLVSEGQQHFENISSAYRWMKSYGSYGNYSEFIYTNNGLLVVWSRDYSDMLFVDVWQIYINGTKPTKLEGAQDDKIQVILP